MFDTMTLTKAVGALCAALLVFLLGNWAADGIYAMGPSHGHDGEEVAQAYTIDTGAEEAPAEAAEEGPAFAELYAAADAAAGEKVFAKCATCHKLDGKDATGPHLNGIVDKAKHSSEGFAYSEAALAVVGQTWTPENLDAFLTNPKAYLPGTKMSFPGLPKPEDRANVIAYLATTK